jgi:hypothetical protein
VAAQVLVPAPFSGVDALGVEFCPDAHGLARRPIEDFDSELQSAAYIDAHLPDHYNANKLRAGFRQS